MHCRSSLAKVLSLLTVVCLSAVATAAARSIPQEPGQSALTGTWIYVKDITKDRPVERQGPPMSPRLTFRVEKDAVVWVRPRGEERYPSDGSVREDKLPGKTTKFSGAWKGNKYSYDTEILSVVNGQRLGLIQRSLEVTDQGLTLTVSSNNGATSVALYRLAKDIALPTPAKAKIDDLKWLAQDWVGMRGQRSIEERWGPPLGGAMLGVSRQVSRGRMAAFEFLRIVEKDGGLAYVAQPGGRAPTVFVMTKLEGRRAVFDNPRHDYPQRITYTLAEDGTMTTTIGFINGGKPRAYEYKREAK